MTKKNLVLTLTVLLFAKLSYAIGITGTVVSSLNFGTLVQGDLGTVVPAGSSETASNASLNIEGDPNTAYSIVLPVSNATMMTGSGGPNEIITFSNFSSFPSPGANGVLAPNGQQMLYIGATLNNLQLNQAPGSYSGTFLVTVSY